MTTGPSPKRIKRAYPTICHPNKPHLTKGLCNSCNHYWVKTRDAPQTERAKLLCEIVAGHDARKAEVAAQWDAERRAHRHGKDPGKRYHKTRNETLRWRYGITQSEYDAMLAAQDGVCAICRKLPNPNRQRQILYVDHCHTTGKIRGLLCPKCNTFVGFLDTDGGLLDRVMEYAARGRDDRPTLHQ